MRGLSSLSRVNKYEFLSTVSNSFSFLLSLSGFPLSVVSLSLIIASNSSDGIRSYANNKL